MDDQVECNSKLKNKMMRLNKLMRRILREKTRHEGRMYRTAIHLEITYFIFLSSCIRRRVATYREEIRFVFESTARRNQVNLASSADDIAAQ